MSVNNNNKAQSDTIQNKFEQSRLKQFYASYNVQTKDVLKSDIYQFRYICFKMVPFIKNILLPKINKKSKYECVMVEFRQLPHLEFILRNAILKLGSQWSYTFICGNENHHFVSSMCETISPNINVIKMNRDNMNQNDYSLLLMSNQFWEMLHGEKILIHQEDTLMFKDNINPFLGFDFVGAPFASDSNDTPNKVGNGGFSLRTKSKMLEVISKCKYEDLILNSSTVSYMTYRGLSVPPEDIYFSKNMQEFGIGIVADWTTSSCFSSEMIFNKDSLGCHKLWVGNKEWKTHIKQVFNFRPYKSLSQLKGYLKYINKPEILDLTSVKTNAFDIDFTFYSAVNNINYKQLTVLFKFMEKNGLHGFIYHPKQLINIFPSITFYSFMNNIYTVVLQEDVYHTMPVQTFVNDYLYNSSFNYLCNISIKEKYSNLNTSYDKLVLVFIGNADMVEDLINKLVEYRKIESEINVAFCFHKDIYKKQSSFKELIKNKFEFYSIFVSNEFGNDIVPTLLMYRIISMKHTFKHIIKLHTKSSKAEYEALTKYLLSVPISELITQKQGFCNSIGSNYLKLTEDLFNSEINHLYANEIDMNKCFIPGSIFYAENNVYDKILIFIQNNNYRSFFINNLYETNMINSNFSAVHFLERLFGVMCDDLLYF